MTPKVKIFKNVFLDSSTGHQTRFVTKFGENELLRSCRKVAWITTHKKTLVPRDSSQPPLCPKWADRAQNSLNVVIPFTCLRIPNSVWIGCALLDLFWKG